ncbi:hypothetical protein N234_16635 [Ralstonia pickettii DTP0602]|nr:hypothetical protein N234_16635 [Ralstonia pickettii DTP0602]
MAWTDGRLLTASVVSHHQDALLVQLLPQLLAIPSMQIVLTINAGGGNFEALDPRIRVIHNAHPKGFGANHNAAFALCQTPYFAVLNPDLRLTDTTFAPLLSCVSEAPGVAGPHVFSPAGTIEDSARRLPSIARLVARRIAGKSSPDYDISIARQQVDWVAGMCLMFDSESFRAVGGFDERYHLYCEDVDICLRLHLMHRQVNWVKDATVIHDARRSSRRRLRYIWWHLSSMMRLFMSVAYWRFSCLRAGG